MSIITISRGSYSRGKEVAEGVAKKLGYECIARDVLLEASKEFNIPEIKLLRAMEGGPSILDRFTYGKEKYIAYIQAAILRHLKRDNVVYHGLAGHFFVKDVPHVLKVRILADFEDRVRLVMERDGLDRKEAVRFLQGVDEQRRRWSKHLYGIDTWEPSLYDLVIHIHKITVNDAVDIIVHTVQLEHFKTTPESQKQMEDLWLAAEVKAALVNIKPDIEVKIENGVAFVDTKAPESKELQLVERMREAVKGIPGLKDIKFHVLPATPYGD